MFSVTFLGHQGWLCRAGATAILVDPLLREPFGDAHALEYRVYPPRLFQQAAMPKLSAVVLTHEHDDHFDIESLAKLSRTIPVYLSARSSDAARAILGTMGFTVHPLVPGRAASIGELEVIPFCGDHVGVNCGDEWDTLPFLVRDKAFAGSFFSMVDITITERHVEWAKKKQPRPGLVSFTNNALDWSHMTDYLVPRNDATQECFVKMGTSHKLFATQWGMPVATMMCAGGFAFEGERAWMNGRVFCVDNEAVCAGLTKVYPKERFVATRPGQTFHMEGGKLSSIDERASFLETAPLEVWPSRKKTDEGRVPDYAPATGRRGITAEERRELEERLSELAAALVGGTVFRSLSSILEDESPTRDRVVALVVRDDDLRVAFEYAPTACAFVPGRGDAREMCLAGMECWASDLLAVLRGHLGPIALTYGRARLWNALPQRFVFDIFGDLYRLSHPLRRPRETLATYERLWARVKDTPKTIAGAAD